MVSNEKRKPTAPVRLLRTRPWLRSAQLDGAVLAFGTSIGLSPPLLPARYIALGGSARDYATGVTAFSATQIVGSLYSGPACARFGGEVVLSVLCFGTALSLILTIAARRPAELIVLRGMAGMFGGVLAVTRTLRADAGRASLARTSSMYASGLSLGPLLVAAVAAKGNIAPAFGTAAVMCGLMGASGMVLRRPRNSPGAGATELSGPQPWGLFPTTSIGEGVWLSRAAASQFLASFAFAAGFTVFPLLARERHGLQPQTLGALFGVTSATCAMGVYHASSWLTRHVGSAAASRLAQIQLAVAVAALGWTRRRTVLFMAFVAQALAFQVSETCLSLAASASGDQGLASRAQGVLQAALATGRLCSPLVCTALYEASKRWESVEAWAIVGEGALPFFVVAVLSLCGAALVPSSRS